MREAASGDVMVARSCGDIKWNELGELLAQGRPSVNLATEFRT